MRAVKLLVLLLVLSGTGFPAYSSGAADGRADEVRALLFHSPRCPHCHDVMRDHLPPLLQQYGEQLRIVAVNVDTPEGQALYRAIVDHFQLSRGRLGVPALVVGDRILVGAWEIPSQFPGIVAAGVRGGGIDWPAIPAVRAFLSLQGIAAEPGLELRGWMVTGGAAGSAGPAVELLGARQESVTKSVRERFMMDPTANAIAVAVLLGMLGVLTLSGRRVAWPRRRLPHWPVWAIPVLALIGAGIASYLAFVEVTGTEAVCGPVGNCNQVQLSAYASIAGVPIGVLGVAGYLLLGLLWLFGRGADARTPLLVWGLAAGGVAFSIYLTFLEPFVIGATCMWCINSAIVMTLILMAATPAAAAARTGGGRRRSAR
jgi:uncharacterized membrane protein/thiol-disulfide isomerase/thioredoxin